MAALKGAAKEHGGAEGVLWGSQWEPELAV